LLCSTGWHFPSWHVKQKKLVIKLLRAGHASRFTSGFNKRFAAAVDSENYLDNGIYTLTYQKKGSAEIPFFLLLCFWDNT
jgi:hypothetical protein